MNKQVTIKSIIFFLHFPATRPAGLSSGARLLDEAREQRDAEELSGDHGGYQKADGDVDEGAPLGQVEQGAQRVGSAQRPGSQSQDDDRWSTAVHLVAFGDQRNHQLRSLRGR
jgi:hypothetical protein